MQKNKSSLHGFWLWDISLVTIEETEERYVKYMYITIVVPWAAGGVWGAYGTTPIYK